MNLLKQLWNDEDGVILSAEMVLMGTVGVIGLTTGLSVLSNSVNEELKDVGSAIRSLDQSYIISGSYGCNASTPGSMFQQTAVETSLSQIQRNQCCQPAVILPEQSPTEPDAQETEPESIVEDESSEEVLPKKQTKRQGKKKKRSATNVPSEELRDL